MRISVYFDVTESGRLMILLPDRMNGGDEAEKVTELLRRVPYYDNDIHVVLKPKDIEVFTTSFTPCIPGTAEQIPD